MTSAFADKLGRMYSNAHRELHTSTVEHDKVDEGILGEWRRRSTKLQELYDNPPTYQDDIAGEEKPIRGDIWSDLVDDIYYEHFGYDDPKVRPRDEIEASRHVNALVAEKYSRSEGFGEMRPSTRNKGMESTLATLGAAKSMKESLSDELAEEAARASEMADTEDALRDIDKQLESLREEHLNDPPRTETQHQGDVRDGRELGRAKHEALKHLRELQSLAAAQATKTAGKVQAAVAKASAAGQAAAEAAEQIPGLGIGKNVTGTGATSIPPDQMLELAERWSKGRLRQIADLLGRLLPDMRTKRRTLRKGGREELVDIEVGNDIALVLPSELVRLKHPDLKLDFMRRFAEGQLMQYEMHSTEDRKKGSLVILLDESASMNEKRIVFAKGVAIALVSMVHREKRDCVVIAFGALGQIEVWRFPKKLPLDPFTLADMAEHHFMGGGTETLEAFRIASGIMVQDAPFHTADIALITDGGDIWTEVDAQLRAEMTKLGVQVHGIAVEIPPTDYMLNWCDFTTPVWELDAPNEATTRLATHVA